MVTQPTDKKSDRENKTRIENLTHCVLKCLNDREQDVLKRRNALKGGRKETLESIGDHYNITRERVRQIERSSFNKIKRLIDYKVMLEDMTKEIDQLLNKFGDTMAHHHLLAELSSSFKEGDGEFDTEEVNGLKFLVEHFMPEFFYFYEPGDVHHAGWSREKEKMEVIKQLIRRLEEFLNEQGKPMTHDEIAERIGEAPDTMYSLLHLSRNIEVNPFGFWGMNTWPEVSPKRMADRIFVILKRYEEPLHYKSIALEIEKNYKKKTHPPTVHNELIADPRFVLVGRGIYALNEWGYMSGTVREVVEDILRKAELPMTRDEIVEAVKKQRFAARSTILLALNMSDRILRNGKDQYSIKEHQN